MSDVERIAQALTIRPGQTLLLRVGDSKVTGYQRELMERMATGVKEALPGVEVLLIVGVDELAVYDPRPEAT